MADEVKLHGMWLSPYTCRVKVALNLKGIPYEFIEEDIKSKSPLLLQYNPVHKKIPVFVHNGKPIAESLVILEYIDETWKNNPLLPDDPYERSRARFWATFADEKIFASTRKAFQSKDEERKEAMEEGYQQMTLIEKELGGKDFFGGETIGYLDIVVFSIAYWLSLGQEVAAQGILTEESFPNLCKWIKKLLDLDIIKQSIPTREKHIALLKAHLQAHKSSASE